MMKKVLLLLFSFLICIFMISPTTPSLELDLSETTLPEVTFAPAEETTPEPTEPAVTEPPAPNPYPIATIVWEFMKVEMDWNDYVAAGVMGNLMAETGGQTLNLKWDLWDKAHEYYGLCQWSKKYYPEMADASFEEQLQFLSNSVESIINTFGSKYEKGFNYERFCQLENAEEAALAFAKCYERCSSKYYAVRQTNAIKAYNYFCAGQ